MNRIYFLAIALSCIYIKAQSQDIASVLRSVERNNMELKVLHNDNQAAIFEIKDRNSLESPSVEYSPFFRHYMQPVTNQANCSRRPSIWSI